MKALILCGGEGKRLKSLTKKIPKPMIPIDGKPVLEYMINLLKFHGIKDIALDVYHFSEKIKEYFGDGSRLKVNIKYPSKPQLLGTSGALNHFKEFLDEPFFVLYGDNITNLNLRKMIESYKKTNSFGAVYLYHEKMANKNTTPGCVLIDKNSFIQEIIENPNKKQKKDLEKISEEYKFTNSGIYIFDPRIFELLPQGESFFSEQTFPKILEKGLKLYGHREECYIREIGQIHRYLKAKKEIESGKIKLK